MLIYINVVFQQEVAPELKIFFPPDESGHHWPYTSTEGIPYRYMDGRPQARTFHELLMSRIEKKD